MKIRKSFLWFAIGLILLSVVTAVYGYEVDNGRYRLDIVGVTIESDDSIGLQLSNSDMNDFDFSTLYTYSTSLDGKKTSGKFSHSLDEPLPIIGFLRYGEKIGMTLPGKDLKCGWPLTIEMTTYKGKLVARYVGIPSCDITVPRRSGLTKLDYCTAEYDDGYLKIKWEILDADDFIGKVKLRKTVGKLEPEDGWYDLGLCPDLESGVCKTEINYILFDSEDGVSVKLDDKRERTSVVLNSNPERPCFAVQEVVVAVDANTEYLGDVADEILSETYLLEANKDNDVRVCLEGCKAEGQCFMEESRARYMGMEIYCKGQNWMVQKVSGKKCSADFECKSEICSLGECSAEKVVENQNWLTRFLLWIDNLI